MKTAELDIHPSLSLTPPSETGTYSLTITLLPGDRGDTEPANRLPENSAPAFLLAGRSRAHYSINAAVIVSSGHDRANYSPRLCPEEHKQPDNEAKQREKYNK
ncbi:hypothetical protein ABG768_006892 [Culter alburnus]|uniref:Uncharacterized protein n=1 Tax=Culter alburnus TaxID=194366 RepID=A0AAW1ZR07_CULAL